MTSNRLSWLALASLPMLACSCQAYDATPAGRILVEWTAPAPTQGTGATVSAELGAPAGARYRVEAKLGQADGRQVPAAVRIELVANPTGAEIDVVCDAPMQFAVDPPEQFSTPCRVSERTGSKGLLGSRMQQQVRTLRVVGDGRILLEAVLPK